MATVTKTYTENIGNYRSTWTLAYTASDITVSGASFIVTPPSLTAKYVYSNKNQGEVDVYLHPVISGVQTQADLFRKYRAQGSMASGTAYTIATSTADGAQASLSVDTSSVFNSSNPTVRSVSMQFVADSVWLWSTKSSDMNIDGSYYGTTATNIFSTPPTITLNAPPTFSSTQVSFTNDYGGDAYAGLTTASVTISGSSAQYGGTISASSLTIGNTTVTGAGDGTISMLLDTAGTFTPTVTVTDSRGQTTTKSLDPIEVKSYVAPEVSFTLERTNASGTVDDEGTYAVATATFNWTDAIATLSQPTASAIDSDGTTLSVSATWYTDRALATAVDWTDTSAWTSPKALYGKIGTLPVNESSQITITPNDSEGTGTAQSQTLASAFYTIDFLAGGHGIAFGQPASQTGLHCDMEATFNRTVDVGEEVSAENVLIQLDTTATSGTDKEIYDALVSLGWDADCIV